MGAGHQLDLCRLLLTSTLPAGDTQGAPLAPVKQILLEGTPTFKSRGLHRVTGLATVSTGVILRSSSFEEQRPGKHRTDPNPAQELNVAEVAARVGCWGQRDTCYHCKESKPSPVSQCWLLQDVGDTEEPSQQGW